MDMTNRDMRRGVRGRSRTAKTRAGKLPGIRWIPVPLALLAALVGWLVYGTVLGQSAAAQADRIHNLQAGGLQLAVQQMEWMSNDMSGQGPVTVSPEVPADPADPSDSTDPGFAMPPDMMPGMQSANDDRLQLEVTLKNITSSVQLYQMSDFRLVGQGGQSWPELSNAGQNTYVNQAYIEPNYSVTVDVYFDVPMTQAKGLSIEWSRGGDKVDLPVNTNAAPMAPMNMH
jgi:hypothetical protein